VLPLGGALGEEPGPFPGHLAETADFLDQSLGGLGLRHF